MHELLPHSFFLSDFFQLLLLNQLFLQIVFLVFIIDPFLKINLGLIKFELFFLFQFTVVFIDVFLFPPRLNIRFRQPPLITRLRWPQSLFRLFLFNQNFSKITHICLSISNFKLLIYLIIYSIDSLNQ